MNGKSTVLNEVYYRKSKELLEAQELLGKIRNDYKNKPYDPRVNVDKNLLKFNRMMADIFGLDTYTLDVQPGMIYNACTLPITLEIDLYDHADKLANKNTFKFNKNARLVLLTVIYQGLLTSGEFTDGEIMAVLLHEMGHNFSGAIDGKIECMQKVRAYMIIVFIVMDIINGHLESIYDIVAIDSRSRKFVLWLDKSIKQNFPGLATVIASFGVISAALRDVITNVMGIVDFFTFGFLSVPSRVIGFLQSILFAPAAYKDEKIADAFATAHGYGPELASALEKMEKNKAGILTQRVLSNIPIISQVQQICSLPAYIITTSFDEHPIYSERLHAQVRYLRKELDKPIDPKLKRAILNDINDLEDLEEKITTKKKKLNDPILVKKFYWAWCLKLSDGDIKHHVIGKNLEDEFDRTSKK